MVHKTERLFCSIAQDHGHEQVNGEIKAKEVQLG